MPYSLEPQNFNLLLVDDTLENLQLLANILTQDGYNVRKSTSSKLALSFVQRQVPDLILLDINMPDINGYEVCRQLKSVPSTAAVPIIFISALDRLDNKIQAFEVGGSDYITKPFQEQEVLMRVKNQLLIQQQKRQVQSKNEHLLSEIAKRQEIERQLEMKLRQERLLHQVIQTNIS